VTEDEALSALEQLAEHWETSIRKSENPGVLAG